MGREKKTYPLVEQAIAGDRFQMVEPLPEDKGTANHRLLDIALLYTLAARGEVKASLGMQYRQRALRLGYSQTRGGGGGLGVVEGRVELWTPQPHDALHLGPLVLIALEAHRAGDREAAALFCKVLSGYFGACDLGATDDGEVVLPGTRFWPADEPPPLTQADGLVHLPEGEVLSQVYSACYRLVKGLPQRGNDGKARRKGWWNRMAPFRGLEYLLERWHAPIKIGDAALYVGIRKLPWDKGLRLVLEDPTGGGGSTHSVAPAVQVELRRPGKHLISYSPRVIPDGWR